MGEATLICAMAGDVGLAAERWSITVCGPASDARRAAVAEAVEFWNHELAGLKVQLSLGPITPCERSIPDPELVRLAEAVLKGEGDG